MEKFVFVKNLNLGIVQLNVKEGQTVLKDGDIFEYENQRYINTRDFHIAIEHKWLIPESEYKKCSKKRVFEVNHNFGYEVKKQQNEGKSIPISNYTVLNEKEGFVEEGNAIKDIKSSNVHVASQKNNESSIQKKEFNKEEQEQIQIQIEESNKEEQNKKQKEDLKSDKKTAKKTPSKKLKEVKKNSKIMKNSQITQEKVAGTVRGMKIIKGE